MSEFPNIIHQTWKTKEIPEKWKMHVASWQKFCVEKNYGYKLWTDDDNRNLIADHYAWFLAFYDGYKYPIQRADAIRYFILHKFGGVYVDCDEGVQETKFTAMDQMLQHFGHCDTSAALPITTNRVWNDILTNCFMIAKKESNFMKHMCHALMNPSIHYNTGIKHILDKTHKFMILCSTGPSLVSDVYLQHKQDISLIPADLISNAKSPSCLLIHAYGRSWHNSSQMSSDVCLIALAIAMAVAVLILLIFLIRYLVQP